ncbi:MAG: NAD(P)(+) transhydrogenase (Re/Si-specific) subunit beta [Planctomycetales bacterium]|nr:NAD(P)(+) transhydrogenase (Re/Si-specific) subunit beta [Planctomycetales bacterium]
MSSATINLIYLVAAVMFILALKGLTHPRTAVRANLTAAVGMLIAIIVTLSMAGISLMWIIVGIVIGSIIGAVMAIRTPMTGMPQMVALLNGFGGIASVLVAGGALVMELGGAEIPTSQFLIATAVSGLIGAVTFTGSLVAFGKLQGLISGQSILLPARQLTNASLFIVAVLLSAWMVRSPDSSEWILLLLTIVSLVLGVLLVLPIGGADMPVVIALLNSYSGLAAAATGFVLENNMLIIAGSLVGASGIILTQIMCKAMNRSLTNVLFGVMDAGGGGSVPQDDIYAGKVKSTSPEEVAMLFDTARRVVIVPGYGMAVSQAQHSVRDLANLLGERGIEVEFGIHPVAGRMPGHMNVLLAEADVPYDQLKDLDDINPTFAQTDVVIVIGANDVVNPLARTDPNSPIAGMPILDVDKAGTVVVVKRSLSPGFAGIPNPLFAADNALMMFGDGQAAMRELVAAVKES